MTEDCDRYRNYLLSEEDKRNITRATVRRRIASLKSFLKYALDTGFIRANPSVNLKMPSARNTAEDRILTEMQVGKLLDAAQTLAKEGHTQCIRDRASRDWLLLSLLYIGAFRVGEISGLTWGQISTTTSGNACIKVIGKGDKERKVIIPSKHLIYLQTIRTGTDKNEPVFRSPKGEAICDRTIRRIVAKYAKLAKLPKIPSPHFLRHSHATHALNRNAPIKVTTKTLGHASAATLLDNYVHAGDEESSSFYLVIE